METPAKTVRVSIFGEEYPLRTEGDADLEYMTRVADHVDRSMRKIADRSPNMPIAKVAILAALNITDELFSERRDAERKLALFQGRTQGIVDWLDARLATESPVPTERVSSTSLSAH
ncbi:MAG: cell division protein ZapA [candidate division Zixibacteria bacterium]|nr:cell division protein ZapA [candidate division Zixibacteria bacterium]